MGLERNALPQPGPQFFRGDDGEVLFQHVIDGGNVLGPRPATQKDQDKHPEVWAYFLKLEAASALDRDAKDGPGGSLPAETAEPAAKPARGQNRHQRRGGKA